MHGPISTPYNAPRTSKANVEQYPNRESNPYREAFWRWWPDLYKDLKHFRMTGGEPTMDPNTYRVFDYVLENPKSDLHMNVTSNFSVDSLTGKNTSPYNQRLCEGQMWSIHAICKS